MRVGVVKLLSASEKSKHTMKSFSMARRNLVRPQPFSNESRFKTEYLVYNFSFTDQFV